VTGVPCIIFSNPLNCVVGSLRTKHLDCFPLPASLIDPWLFFQDGNLETYYIMFTWILEKWRSSTGPLAMDPPEGAAVLQCPIPSAYSSRLFCFLHSFLNLDTQSFHRYLRLPFYNPSFFAICSCSLSSGRGQHSLLILSVLPLSLHDIDHIIQSLFFCLPVMPTIL
jgi:hypothetical protein